MNETTINPVEKTVIHIDNIELHTKSISDLAKLALLDWKRVYFGAVPYLDAMRSLLTVDDKFYEDDGRSIVAYFLSNASTWRGPVAKAVKAELKARIGR